ncbi:MAG: tRNA preQ1(34) S-adenosylmethionine ribosyltransferase-isomerase QueA [Clostridia bacterium]|nr:tRNA preQ1(34) S-adenosylmethionine ribosyltransferase-isomerase QueA [Clostridia bacterium]
MRTSDFAYDLPEELIAQEPAPKRDESRLLVLRRETGSIEHRHFFDLVDYLKPGDTLVLNDSKVIPARLTGEKVGPSPRVPVEFLLLRQMEDDRWEAMVHPGRRLKPGTVAEFGEGRLTGEVEQTLEDGTRVIRFRYDHTAYPSFFALLDEIGSLPLPPYIRKKQSDESRYQTVYAKWEGSAAAPTAGLHFTKELLESVRGMGVSVAPVLLHVGLGTFRPVKEEKIKDHVMHREYYSVSEESADLINRTRQNGGRILAVGTTAVRTLETVSDERGFVRPQSGETGIFIYPGYRFKAVDAMITNFHLPESTLLMLVSAFSDRETILKCYQEAIQLKYRFFSFGDAMLIL